MKKNDMARVIVQALRNTKTLPASDDPEVVKRAKFGTMATLTSQHQMAIAALNSVKT